MTIELNNIKRNIILGTASQISLIYETLLTRRNKTYFANTKVGGVAQEVLHLDILAILRFKVVCKTFLHQFRILQNFEHKMLVGKDFLMN